MASDTDDSGRDATRDATGALDALARRYLDLWQNQLSGLASDPAVTEQIARLFAAANSQMASAMQAAQGTAHAAGSSQTGTATAAAPSRDGADDLDELRKRVAALEARVAELEAGLRRP